MGRQTGKKKKKKKNATEDCKLDKEVSSDRLFFSSCWSSPLHITLAAAAALTLGCICSHQYGQKTWSAPAVCLSASLPYHYGRLINKHELIQEKREPRYEHQICQSGTIFRQQMMLSFEGDLPETRLREKRQNRPHQAGCNNNGRCVASV